MWRTFGLGKGSFSTPNLSKGWHNFAIVDYIEKRFGIKAKLENDANACAVAEWKFGAGKGAKNVVFMTFGTGLGAGLILDGKLYSGTNGNAGEVGHIRLEKDGPIGYNKAGSAEGFCSGGGIQRLTQIRAKEKGLEIDKDITTKVIFEKAKQGDVFYLSIVQEGAEKFAKVVSILIDLFNPEVIIAEIHTVREIFVSVGRIIGIVLILCIPQTTIGTAITLAVLMLTSLINVGLVKSIENTDF